MSLSISSSYASQMASSLFAKLDTRNQGYIEKSDLQSAFDQISGSSSAGSASVDDVFSQLDANGDGKVTKDEMSSGLQTLADQLDSQFDSMRASRGMGGMNGMPPPPPPPGGNDSGFTKSELTAQLQQVGTSDSKRSDLITKIVNNFDQADTDGDGKVSFQEAMAYDRSSSTASSTSTSGSDTASTTGSSTTADLMKKMMQLMQAYGILGQDSTQSGRISISA